MSKIAIIADTHWGIRNDLLPVAESTAKFFDEVFFPELERRKITTIVHLGDVFDRRKFVNFSIAALARKHMIEPMINGNYDVRFVIGNHDTYFKNTNDLNSPVIMYGHRHGFRFYQDPVDVELEGLRVIMFPYIPKDDEEQLKYAEAIETSKARVLLGHLDVDGFDFHKGIPGHGRIKPSDLRKFELCLSGHFHTPSVKGNIRYVGAAAQYSWSDYDDERGFTVLDTETLETEFIANPFENFAKIVYDDVENSPDDILKTVSEARANNKFVKLIIKNKTDDVLYDRVVDRLEASVGDLKIVDDHHHIDEISDEEIMVEVSDTIALLEQMIDRSGRPELSNMAKELVRYLHSETME